MAAMMDRPHTRKSPQSKKAESYAKDRRNAYGENSKASRKAIPRRKAIENRNDRRAIHQTLPKLSSAEDEKAALIESSVRPDMNRVGGWRKQPDKTLAEHVAKRRV